MTIPVSFDYHEIINSFKNKRLTEREVEKRLSDLMLLLDFSSSLVRLRTVEEVADLLLLTSMGYTAARRASFLSVTSHGFSLIASKGHAAPLVPDPELARRLVPPYPPHSISNQEETSVWHELSEAVQAGLLLPVYQENRLLAIITLGDRRRAVELSAHELHVLATLAQISAASLENAQAKRSLLDLNRQLQVKIYQLNTLFELSRDFYSVWEAESIFRILGSSLIGHLLVSRCAVLAIENKEMQIRFLRGVRFSSEQLSFIREIDASALFEKKWEPLDCSDLPQQPLHDFCATNKFHLLFPMVMNDELRGILFLGNRKNRKVFESQDFDFITALINLALVSEENGRMQQQMVEKQRMEKELAIAREIQFGLLPRSIPVLKDYELTSIFEPCYQVGGDYFDFLPVSNEKLAIAIGDVSGKSTPAALVMATVQASLRTLASMQVFDPVRTIHRLNRFLCESQAANKYVTFFYGVLDSESHTFHYVNAGHCYPLIIRQSGIAEPLQMGGTVMGFFKNAKYESGKIQIDPGDLIVFYTDGVSELLGPGEEEFGTDRIVTTLSRLRGKTVAEIREDFREVLDKHRENYQPCDDLTFILLKRELQ